MWSLDYKKKAGRWSLEVFVVLYEDAWNKVDKVTNEQMKLEWTVGNDEINEKYVKSYEIKARCDDGVLD